MLNVPPQLPQHVPPPFVHASLDSPFKALYNSPRFRSNPRGSQLSETPPDSLALADHVAADFHDAATAAPDPDRLSSDASGPLGHDALSEEGLLNQTQPTIGQRPLLDASHYLKLELLGDSLKLLFVYFLGLNDPCLESSYSALDSVVVALAHLL